MDISRHRSQLVLIAVRVAAEVNTAMHEEIGYVLTTLHLRHLSNTVFSDAESLGTNDSERFAQLHRITKKYGDQYDEKINDEFKLVAQRTPLTPLTKHLAPISRTPSNILVIRLYATVGQMNRQWH